MCSASLLQKHVIFLETHHASIVLANWGVGGAPPPPPQTPLFSQVSKKLGGMAILLCTQTHINTEQKYQNKNKQSNDDEEDDGGDSELCPLASQNLRPLQAANGRGCAPQPPPPLV